MPSTMELSECRSLTPDRHDSAFYDDDPLPHMVTALDRVKATIAENSHVRTASVDSGVDLQSPSTLTVPTLPMKRAGSATQLGRPKASSTTAIGNSTVSNQTMLLLQKMEILEKKLQSMDAQLKQERVLRLSLEAKVVKLEEDRDQLAEKRAKASVQLQDFSEKFFATMEAASQKSPSPSPHPSFADLRSLSRTGSLSSMTSSTSGLRSRPLSGVSLASN